MTSHCYSEAAGVMCRSGNHCVHSWFNDRGHKNGSLRAKAYFYNTEDEAKLFAETLSEVVNAFLEQVTGEEIC